MTSALTFGEIGTDKIVKIFCQNPLIMLFSLIITTCKATHTYIYCKSDHIFVSKSLSINIQKLKMKMAPNDSKCLQMAPNHSKWLLLA